MGFCHKHSRVIVMDDGSTRELEKMDRIVLWRPFLVVVIETVVGLWFLICFIFF